MTRYDKKKGIRGTKAIGLFIIIITVMIIIADILLIFNIIENIPIIGEFFAFIDSNSFRPLYFILLIILVFSGLILLVRWHARNHIYQCQNCGHEFEVSSFTDFVSPHGPGLAGGWKYLKCPSCQKRSRALEIRKTKRDFHSSDHR